MSNIIIQLPSPLIPTAYSVRPFSPVEHRQAVEAMGLQMQACYPSTESRFTEEGHRDGEWHAFLELGGPLTRGGGPYIYGVFVGVTSAAVFVRREGWWRLDWMHTPSWLWPNASWARWTKMFGAFEVEMRNLAALEPSWLPLTAWSGLIREDSKGWRAQVERPHAWDHVTASSPRMTTPSSN